MELTRTFCSLTLTVALVMGVSGCGGSGPAPSSASAADQIVNTVCPIMGGEVASDVTVDWNGRKVGFCCPPCIEEWAELTDDEKTAKLASAAARAHDHVGGAAAP